MATKTNQKKIKYISIKAFKERPLSLNDDELAHMCRTQKLSFKFLREYAMYLDWKALCYNNRIKLTEELVEDPKVMPYIVWNQLCWRYAHVFSLDFIRRNIDRINWYSFIQAKKPLPEDFVIEMINKIPLDVLLTYQINYYSESFWRVLVHKDPDAFRVGIQTNQVHLSKDFMREIQGLVNPDLFLNTKRNDWDTMKEYKKDFNENCWTTWFRDMKEIDINAALRFKELVHWERYFTISWMQKFKNYVGNIDKQEKVFELKKYMNWLSKYLYKDER